MSEIKKIEKKSFQAHDSPLNCLAITPDGLYVICGGQDKRIGKWNLGTGENVWYAKTSKGVTEAVALSHDGKLVACGGEDFILRIFNAENPQKPIMSKKIGKDNWIQYLAFTPDDKYIVGKYNSIDIMIWDSSTAEVVSKYSNPSVLAKGFQLSPDGNFIIAGEYSGRIYIYDRITTDVEQIAGAHVGEVNGIAVSNNGKYLASASIDKKIKIWDLKTRQLLKTIKSDEDKIYKLQFTHDDNFLVSMVKYPNTKDTIVVWDYMEEKKVYAYDFYNPSDFVISPDSRTLITCGMYGYVHLWQFGFEKEEKPAHLEERIQPSTEKKPAITPTGTKEIPQVSISRGFEVAKDTFKFFVRVENNLEYALTNVAVRLLLPQTLKLDKKTKSSQYNLGTLGPHKFGSGIYYLFCEACADTVINASIEYNDPKGDYQVIKMEPFNIFSCKYIAPRTMNKEEFEQKIEGEDKKTIEIGLSNNISKEKAMQVIRDRLTMDTVFSGSDLLEMSGATRDGLDVLFKSMIREIQGVKTLVATVVTSNQNVQMGALSDIMEAFKDFRSDASEKLDDLKKGQEDIKETVIVEASKILANQLTVYEALEKRNGEISEQIKTLNKKFEDLELSGDFNAADSIKAQIDLLRTEFRTQHEKLETSMEGIVSNIETILENQDDIEQFLLKKFGSDIDKFKDILDDLRRGNINKKQFVWKCVKTYGLKFIKNIISKYVPV